MRLTLTESFQKLPLETGTIQNFSTDGTAIELTPDGAENTGLILWPFEKYSFTNQTVYARGDGGEAKAAVVPFIIDGDTYNGTEYIDTRREVESKGERVTLAGDTKRVLTNKMTVEGDTRRNLTFSALDVVLLGDTIRILAKPQEESGEAEAIITCGMRMRNHLISQFWWEVV